jgi:hypothetical protein
MLRTSALRSKARAPNAVMASADESRWSAMALSVLPVWKLNARTQVSRVGSQNANDLMAVAMQLGVDGLHNVYVVFNGDGTNGNLNWFRFG